MLIAALASLGGFIGGGLTVYGYAKATHQEIEWRRIDIVRIAQRVFFGIPWRQRQTIQQHRS